MTKIIITISLFASCIAIASETTTDYKCAITQARNLIKLTGTSDLIIQGVVMTASSSIDQYNKEHGIANNEKEKAEVVEIIKGVAIESLPVLEDEIATIYTKYYTCQELKDVVAFYRTPTGQKTIKMTPNILQESFEVGQKWSQWTVMPALQKKL